MAFFFFIFLFVFLLYAQEKKPVEPVDWKQLAPFLIDIKGWEVYEEAEGSTFNIDDFKVSQVEQSYSSGDKDLTIEIVDGGYVPDVYEEFKNIMTHEVDSSEESIKKITIKGFPGYEKYDYEDKEAEIVILISDRFLVHLNGTNFKDTAELKEIANILDLNGIAKIGK